MIRHLNLQDLHDLAHDRGQHVELAAEHHRVTVLRVIDPQTKTRLSRGCNLETLDAAAKDLIYSLNRTGR